MDLYRLAYISGETSRFSPMELHALLVSSRERNEATGITGLLLYKHGNFMQVIEGAQEDVESLFERLKKDPRHRRVIAFIKEPVAKRDFPDWSMSFRNLETDDDPVVSGFDSFLNDPLKSLEAGGYPEQVRKWLSAFVKATGGR